MFDLRILNLISFGLLALAFFVATAKLGTSRALNRQLETAFQERLSEDRATVTVKPELYNIVKRFSEITEENNGP